jgi:carbamoyl-phosphate synthase small subunit
VQYLKTGHVEVTTQNHGFAVGDASVAEEVAEVTHVNLNDRTVEGLRFKKHVAISVQYHPEASPGPHDSRYLFEMFLDEIAKHRGIPVRKKIGPTVSV